MNKQIHMMEILGNMPVEIHGSNVSIDFRGGKIFVESDWIDRNQNPPKIGNIIVCHNGEAEPAYFNGEGIRLYGADGMEECLHKIQWWIPMPVPSSKTMAEQDSDAEQTYKGYK